MLKRNDSPLVDLMPRSDESLYLLSTALPGEGGLIVDCSDSGQFSRLGPNLRRKSGFVKPRNEQEAQEKRAFARGFRVRSGDN